MRHKNLSTLSSNIFLRQRFQRRFPYEPDAAVSVNDIRANAQDFEKWNNMSGMLAFLLLLVMPPLYACFLNYPYLLVYKHLFNDPALFLPADWLIFALPGFFLTLFALFPSIEYIQRLFLKKKFAVYKEYSNRKEGVDTRKVYRHVSKILFLPLIVSLVQAWACHIVLYPDKFECEQFLDIGPHKHAYTEVKKIIYFEDFIALNGDRRKYPHYRIVFRDNTTLAIGFSFKENGSEAKLLHQLANKGIKTDTVVLDTSQALFQ